MWEPVAHANHAHHAHRDKDRSRSGPLGMPKGGGERCLRLHRMIMDMRLMDMLLDMARDQ